MRYHIVRNSFPGLLAVQLPFMVLLILLKLRSERYHGTGSRKINPHLDRYLGGEIE